MFISFLSISSLEDLLLHPHISWWTYFYFPSFNQKRISTHSHYLICLPVSVCYFSPRAVDELPMFRPRSSPLFCYGRLWFSNSPSFFFFSCIINISFSIGSIYSKKKKWCFYLSSPKINFINKAHGKVLFTCLIFLLPFSFESTPSDLPKQSSPKLLCSPSSVNDLHHHILVVTLFCNQNLI